MEVALAPYMWILEIVEGIFAISRVLGSEKGASHLEREKC